ncbi:putative glucan endo-1,3-beta-glucosidase btgC [Madurella mycetomatis]|uniref:glucan endo-1,3-beta-D-glucosidase n=1 Tax=Madurella mycetomatis TaxID=100816 RepID=A0A175VXD9_9PEZI|nr:putative glucan endo-1,3-beta-glucosidase btgC [Madurella mycetomatis]
MAQPLHHSDDEFAERRALGSSISSSPHHQQHQQRYHYQQDPYNASRPHHDPSFERLRAQRRYGQETPSGRRDAGPYALAGASSNSYGQTDGRSPVSPQRSSPQSESEGRYWGHGAAHPPQTHQHPSPQSTVTPGADNFSDAAAGGMAGIALSIAEQNARESGLNAIHSPYYHQQQQQQQPYRHQGLGQGYAERGIRAPRDYPPPGGTSHSSLQGLNSSAAVVGFATPGQRTPSRSPHAAVNDIYTDDPYQNLSSHQNPSLGAVNPNDIEDDGDDGLEYARKGPRTSMLSIGSSHRDRNSAVVAGGVVAGGVAAGGVLGGLVGRNGSGSLSTQYAPVNNGVVGDGASGGSGGGGAYTGSALAMAGGEKAGWGAPKPSRLSGRKWKLIIIFTIAGLVFVGIILGVLFGIVFKNLGGGDNSSDGSSQGDTATADADTRVNGDLNLQSAEIQELMNNPNLRKVFPGMDYTPLNTQYPECIHNPASQNNITRDLAVLSQLTSTVRLYGTDCNQTQMLIHAVDQLELKGKVKIWLGVWQDGNATTNERQLDQMWDILERYDSEYFKGVIVANEILFREQMNITRLGTLLEEVRRNMSERGLPSMPVATSDLGDKWTETLASQSDAIMANIHPFFAGEPASTAADWTMYFWGNKTGTFLKSDASMNIIAETGWPSQGGMACGNEFETDCPDRSVAGIDEMNIFMEDWVCRALEDGTEYFWFEAFDEPWKIKFNTEGKEWEDHWGLMDVNRRLKDGLRIPDCGGMRVP